MANDAVLDAAEFTRYLQHGTVSAMPLLPSPSRGLLSRSWDEYGERCIVGIWGIKVTSYLQRYRWKLANGARLLLLLRLTRSLL